MRHTPAELRTAAEWLCIAALPPRMRKSYVTDIRAKCKAEPIVYLLQALSTGLTTTFLGLLVNHLYDKFKEPAAKATDVEALLRRHELKLAELEAMIQLSESRDAVKAFELHNGLLLRIRAADPTVEEMVADALAQLERYGRTVRRRWNVASRSTMSSMRPNPAFVRADSHRAWRASRLRRPQSSRLR